MEQGQQDKHVQTMHPFDRSMVYPVKEEADWDEDSAVLVAIAEPYDKDAGTGMDAESALFALKKRVGQPHRCNGAECLEFIQRPPPPSTAKPSETVRWREKYRRAQDNVMRLQLLGAFEVGSRLLDLSQIHRDEVELNKLIASLAVPSGEIQALIDAIYILHPFVLLFYTGLSVYALCARAVEFKRYLDAHPDQHDFWSQEPKQFFKDLYNVDGVVMSVRPDGQPLFTGMTSAGPRDPDARKLDYQAQMAAQDPDEWIPKSTSRGKRRSASEKRRERRKLAKDHKAPESKPATQQQTRPERSTRRSGKSVSFV